jgi:hypothetical protein
MDSLLETRRRPVLFFFFFFFFFFFLFFFFFPSFSALGLSVIEAIRCDRMKDEIYVQTATWEPRHYYVFSLKEGSFHHFSLCVLLLGCFLGEVWPMITTYCSSSQVPLEPDPLYEYVKDAPPANTTVIQPPTNRKPPPKSRPVQVEKKEDEDGKKNHKKRAFLFGLRMVNCFFFC